MKFMTFFIIFLLSLTSVMAYNSSNIKAYYDMEGITNINSTHTIILDAGGNFDMEAYRSVSYLYIDPTVRQTNNGKIGKGLEQQECYNNLCAVRTIDYTTGILNTNSSWSLNVWYMRTKTGNVAFQQFITIRSLNSSQAQDQQTTNFIVSRDINTDVTGAYGYYRNSSGAFPDNYRLTENVIAVNGTWYMATLTYNNDTKQIKIYYNNGLFKNDTTIAQTIGGDYLEIQLTSGYTIYDELSIWDTELSEDDVATLYNNGYGLSLAETIDKQNDTTYQGNITHFYNQCFLSSNISAYLCLDVEVTYNPPSTICKAENIVPCGDVNCNDNEAYYLSLGTLPPNNDYEGACITCNNSCNKNMELTCYSEYISQICVLDVNSGCYYLQTYEVCGIGQKCNAGYCQYAGNSTSLTGNPVDDTLTGANLSKGTKLLIVFGVMILLIGAFIGIGFATNTPTISTIIGAMMSAFALFIFTSFGWIPSYLMIILIVVALAILSFIGFGSRNNNGGG